MDGRRIAAVLVAGTLGAGAAAGIAACGEDREGSVEVEGGTTGTAGTAGTSPTAPPETSPTSP